MLFPVVSAAAGYLLDGVTSAVSGLLIPLARSSSLGSSEPVEDALRP